MSKLVRTTNKAYFVGVMVNLTEEQEKYIDDKFLPNIDSFIAKSKDFKIADCFNGYWVANIKDSEKLCTLLATIIPETKIKLSTKPSALKEEMPYFNDIGGAKDYVSWYRHNHFKLNDIVLFNEEINKKILTFLNDAIEKHKVRDSELYNTQKLCLPNYVLVFTDMNMEIIYTYDKHDKTLKIVFTNIYGDFIKAVVSDIWCDDENIMYDTTILLDKNNIGEKRLNDNYIDFAVKTYYVLNWWLTIMPSGYHKSTETQQETIQVGKGNKKRYKQQVVLKNFYDLHATNHLTKKYVGKVITCLCWGVRGHERHLSNGKTVFVKPYQKGKERNKEKSFVGKEYQL